MEFSDGSEGLDGSIWDFVDPEQGEKDQELVDAIANSIADFILVVGNVNGFVEAQTASDYFGATAGLIPTVGDGAKFAAKTVTKIGDDIAEGAFS